MHQPLIWWRKKGKEVLISNLEKMLLSPDSKESWDGKLIARAYKNPAKYVEMLSKEGYKPKIMLDFSGILLEALEEMKSLLRKIKIGDEKLGDIISLYKKVMKKYPECIEFAGTAYAHCYFPATPVEDWEMQISEWKKTFKRLFGLKALKNVKGFWLPEMGVPSKDKLEYLLKLLKDFGYEWIILPPEAVDGFDRLSMEERIKMFCKPHRLNVGDEEIAARLRVVSNLIKEHTSTLTFTNTRDFAEVLTSRLKQAFPSLKVENHHSSLSKEIRIRVENDFKAQKLKGIICTSSLELGIDIGSVDFVIQYMSPRQVSRIIQRVGRSGHRLERVSEGVIITTDEDDIFESAVIARKALNGELEPLTIHENALDVLAHQIVGITRDKKRASLDEIFRIIKRAYPFRKLQKKDFFEVCKFMESLRFIFIDEKLRVGRKGLLYYFENLSTIPDTKSYSVIDVTTNTRVGSLDEEFVALHAQEGVDFIIKGEPWRIISIEENKIYVEPSSKREAAIPGWEGELIPVPFEVAQEVGRLRGFIERELKKKMSEENLIEEIRNSYPVDENSAKKMIKLISKQLKHGVVPTDKKILVETHENFIILHTCLGSKGNETLGRLLSSLIANRIGSVALKTDPYRIILQVQVKNLNFLKDILPVSYTHLTLPTTERV